MPGWNALYQSFIDGITNTSPTEAIAVIAGIASVWLSRAESIWVYPVGLINTVFYIYLSIKGSLPGEASVNIYYTILSIYGWVLWARKDARHKPELRITFSTRREWGLQLLFGAVMYGAIFFALTYLKKAFYPGAIPWADAFASATAYTGMWLMARKKVESWIWWLATDAASVPLYIVKGYAFTGVQFLVFTILAVAGLISWWKKAKEATTSSSDFDFLNAEQQAVQ